MFTRHPRGFFWASMEKTRVFKLRNKRNAWVRSSFQQVWLKVSSPPMACWALRCHISSLVALIHLVNSSKRSWRKTFLKDLRWIRTPTLASRLLMPSRSLRVWCLKCNWFAKKIHVKIQRHRRTISRPSFWRPHWCLRQHAPSKRIPRTWAKWSRKRKPR